MKNTVLIKKETATRKGEKFYLLGQDTDGVKYWLVAPSWDCGWYWGFGYVQTFTKNSNPATARDIDSHQHADGVLIGKNAGNGEYVHNPIDAAILAGGATFDEREGWELGELFHQFYSLKEAAEIFHRGKANIANTEVHHDGEKCKATAEFINGEMIPAITARICEILSNNN